MNIIIWWIKEKGAELFMPILVSLLGIGLIFCTIEIFSGVNMKWGMLIPVTIAIIMFGGVCVAFVIAYITEQIKEYIKQRRS